MADKDRVKRDFPGQKGNQGQKTIPYPRPAGIDRDHGRGCVVLTQNPGWGVVAVVGGAAVHGHRLCGRDAFDGSGHFGTKTAIFGRDDAPGGVWCRPQLSILRDTRSDLPKFHSPRVSPRIWAGGPLPVTTLLVLFSFFLALAFWAQLWLKRVEVVSLTMTIRKALAGASVLTWSAATVWLYVQMLSFPVPPEPRHSDENAYPAVLRRSQGIAALSPRQADAASIEIAELVKKPCFVVVPWNAGLRERRNYEANMIAGQHDLRLVGRNLAAQAGTIGLSSATGQRTKGPTSFASERCSVTMACSSTAWWA